MNLPTVLSKDNLEKLLKPRIGPNVKIVSYTVLSLTKPGDNYGSTMAIIKMQLEDEFNSLKELNIIGKFFPTVPILCTLINITVTFKKEVELYELALPEYKILQEENGISGSDHLNIFPLYFGSRLSLKENVETADVDAILLLENLKIQGYCNGDRNIGLNLEHTESVLIKLAYFHAINIALKIKKPDIFKSTVKKAGISCTWGPSEDVEAATKWKKVALDALGSIPECKKYVGKVEELLLKEEKNKTSDVPPKEPFATLIHNDFWIGNIMFSHGEDESFPTEIKFVDFQLTKYHSPIKDIVFFLYTSTADGVVRDHYDHLIGIYHKSLVDCLCFYGCYTEDFSFESLGNEFDRYAITEFSRLFFILKVFCAEESNVPDIMNFSLDKLLDGRVGAGYINKMKTLVLDFVHKGWI